MRPQQRAPARRKPRDARLYEGSAPQAYTNTYTRYSARSPNTAANQARNQGITACTYGGYPLIICNEYWYIVTTVRVTLQLIFSQSRDPPMHCTIAIIHTEVIQPVWGHTRYQFCPILSARTFVTTCVTRRVTRAGTDTRARPTVPHTRSERLMGRGPSGPVPPRLWPPPRRPSRPLEAAAATVLRSVAHTLCSGDFSRPSLSGTLDPVPSPPLTKEAIIRLPDWGDRSEAESIQ